MYKLVQVFWFKINRKNNIYQLISSKNSFESDYNCDDNIRWVLLGLIGKRQKIK